MVLEQAALVSVAAWEFSGRREGAQRVLAWASPRLLFGVLVPEAKVTEPGGAVRVLGPWAPAARGATIGAARGVVT